MKTHGVTNPGAYRVIAVAAMASALTFTHVAGAQNIGYVVGSDNSGQSFDDGWMARLGTLGYSVTQFPENTLATDPVLATMNLLIVSSDVGSGGFLSGIGLNQPQPIITFEYGLYDDIFGASNNGTTDGAANDISILDAASPLAAGLTGNVSVYTGTGGGSRADLASVTPGTDVVAGSVLDPTFGILMALEPGQVGGGGNTWSAVRMAVPGYADWDPTLVTAEGWQILDGAVAYALVPEPSSFALLGLGMAMVFVRRRSR